VALPIEEQRMLDEMERKLAAEDPRLASRFNAFGQQGLQGALTSRRARAVSALLAGALIAAVTVMMFVLSPYGAQRSDKQATKPPPAHVKPTSSPQATHQGRSS
jgi:hypothetical protein